MILEIGENETGVVVTDSKDFSLEMNEFTIMR